MGNINFLSVAFAIFFFWMAWHVRQKRATNPSGMPRLQVFKRKWGETVGDRVHWCLYVALPFLLALMMVANALRGRGPFSH